MSSYIHETAKSRLVGGIEVLSLYLTHKLDLEGLAREASRSIHPESNQYAIAEWLLSEIDRTRDLERVCGLGTQPTQDGVLVVIELRQPGLQIEEWLRKRLPFTAGPDAEGGLTFMFANDTFQRLVARSLVEPNFTKTHPPYWLQPDYKEAEAATARDAEGTTELTS